jgi:hypothetical protein
VKPCSVLNSSKRTFVCTDGGTERIEVVNDPSTTTVQITEDGEPLHIVNAVEIEGQWIWLSGVSIDHTPESRMI